ncbi:PAS domain-containing sensor histidine kinase [Mucilaginibacter paludis]|uniref:histidine kinase n=1 Tax=Mucilaginibacter paludis DSM 18603 TaxID=714943 RepID=H1Y6Y4_9SPHI|nr:PAS domain-containing sensor histidine kinase [Mucilaginibacter paludis]EHQ28391.1 PAS/PAC sensor signal transduction histidine kinase [Mucilaginibacter paludis DSM 18603]
MPDKTYLNIGENPEGCDAIGDHYLLNTQLHNLIESTNIGLWERGIETEEAWWSPKFCELLGYNYGEIEQNYSFFLNHIVHPSDRETVYNSFQNHLHHKTRYKVEFRMLTKADGYRWFESTGKAWLNQEGKPLRMLGAVIDIDSKKRNELNLKKNEFLLNETNKIARIGGWELDVITNELIWSKEVYDIHELDEHEQPDIETTHNFYEPGYRETVARAVKNCIEHCQAYDLELKFRTAKDNVVWIRTKGVPVIDEHGNCVAIRGIFQNINDDKLKELNLQKSLDLLSDQNKRLQNFAHIVSHNLRSHSGNLEFMVNLFEEEISEDEQKEIFTHIRSISNSLATTIEHLNEIVKIQTEINNDRKEVDFDTTFNNVLNAINNNITETNALIYSDFSLCPTVNYVPAYLESIFLNLATNSLKYRNPERRPEITCKTYLEDGHTYLTFADNGLGIDLEKYGDKVFGMYKTFHQNANAKGIGLFITRNQIESLGGSIKIESTVNIGTLFTIKLI